MLKPTEAELAQAKDLGIDPGNMNGPQLRKEIGLALRRERVIKNPESARSETFKRLSVVARSLRLPAIPHEQMAALKARIETRLTEVFDQKGIKAGVTVQYGPVRASTPVRRRSLSEPTFSGLLTCLTLLSRWKARPKTPTPTTRTRLHCTLWW